jgi:hypothetical protein
VANQQNKDQKTGQSSQPTPGQQQGQQGNQFGQHVGMQKPSDEGKQDQSPGGAGTTTGRGGQTGTGAQRGSKDTNKGGQM